MRDAMKKLLPTRQFFPRLGFKPSNHVRNPSQYWSKHLQPQAVVLPFVL